MNKFLKSILALGITSAVGLSSVNAATYRVIDKGDVDSLKNTYAQQENNVGEMAVSGTDLYNFPVQFQYFDDEDFDRIVSFADQNHEDIFGINDIEDEDALRAGNPTANDLFWAVLFLEGQSTNRYQKVGNTVAMTNLGTSTEEFVVNDVFFEGTDQLTRSTVDVVNGFTNAGWAYGAGTAPYLPFDFTESDDEVVTYWTREFGIRGFFSPDNGQSFSFLVPPESRFGGGQSDISDISENNIAVGYVSVGLYADYLEYVLDTDGGCADPNVLDDIPFEVCLLNWRFSKYHLMAYKAQLSLNGEIVVEPLGLLVTPHPDDDRTHSSYALAVNQHGVAVGFADGWDDETVTEPGENESSRYSYAVVYKDGEVIDINGDHSEGINSKAYDINDAGIAVGHILKSVNGNARQKFFYVDTNVDAEDIELVLPVDFFTGSGSTARAINEIGFVVGEGEVETHNDSNSRNPRRTNGFLYDINNDVFTNLNDFLTCDSDYTIVEARDINDVNVISATAIVKTVRRDSKGEIMLDENGEQLVEDVVRAVTLEPISGGEVDDCSEVEEKVERKGAGFGFISLLALFTFGLRRKFIK